MSSYVSTPLYGGAIVVDFPSKFTDISKLRQVPDHQEVYMDKDGWASIIIDITKRVGGPGSGPAIDGAAMTAHLEDIVAPDIDTVQVWQSSNTEFSKLPEGIPALTLIATQTPPPEPGSKSPVFTAIVLTMVRLEREDTDIMIAINVPHIKGEYSEEDVDLQMGKQGRLIGDAVENAARIWETFKIKDWDLFVKD